MKASRLIGCALCLTSSILSAQGVHEKTRLRSASEPAGQYTHGDWRFVAHPQAKLVMTFQNDAKLGWLYRGTLVRGQVPRGSTFGDSIAMKDDIVVVLDRGDWDSEVTATYYQNVRFGFRQIATARASGMNSVRCAGGISAEAWVEQYSNMRECQLDWSFKTDRFLKTREHF